MRQVGLVFWFTGLSIKRLFLVLSCLVLVACSGNGDQIAPSAPTELTAVTLSTEQIFLTWNAANDNISVTGYKIYRNGTLLKTVGNTSTSDPDLIAGTTYYYEVAAYDEAGNTSGLSNVAYATTWPLIKDIVAALKFLRITGNAGDGAVLSVGSPESWYSIQVATPTVIFYGKKYMMWFRGQTADPETPYGLRERIGLAVSSDGINFTLANDGNPVLEPGMPGKFDDAGVTHPPKSTT